MAKRRREADPDDAAAETADLNTVFVDTSLDTHLAMPIATSDTASEFKKKVALEHMQCFPEMGEIQVHSLKVKRRSTFYHLPDCVLVCSAFHGVKKNWFLSIDASSIPSCQSIRNSSELGTSSDMKIGLNNIDDTCRVFTSDADRNDALSLCFRDGAAEKNAVSEMIVGPKVDKPVEMTTNSHRSIYSMEHFMGAESRAKKKRKVSLTKDAFQNPGLEVGGTISHRDGKDRKSTMSDSIVKVSGARNDEYDVEGRRVFEEISPPTMAEKIMDFQNVNGSDGREGNIDSEAVLDYQHSCVVSVMLPNSSARLMDVSGGGEDGNTARRKKKKIRKIVEKIQDTTDIEHIEKDERMDHSTDNHKCDQIEEGKVFSLKNDHEANTLSDSKAESQVDPNLTLTHANFLQDAEKSDFCNVNSEKFLDLSGKKEALESKLDFELDQDVPTVQSGGVCANIPNISARLVGAGGNTGDVNSERKKRKKKKVQPTAARVQDARDDEQIGNVEIEKLHAETINFDGKEEGNGLSLKHDYEVRVPSDSKTPDNSHPDLARARDADALIDTEISNGSKKRKKKKRGKKPLGASIENPGITEIHTGIKSSLGLPSPSSGHIPRESGKEEIINLNEGKDVQMKSLDASDHDAPAKVTNVLDVNVVDKKMAGNTKSSAGDCNADIPTAETENIIMEPYQADKDNGSTKNGDIKAKKRRKMKKHTTRDVQENSLVKDQQVAIEILAEKETSIGFEISEQETRHVDSPQILSHKNEEKVDMMHEPVVNTDDIAENSAKDSEGIKFKQYFVPSQNQVDSVAKGRKGTKSKRSSKKAEDNDSPSVNISTELQNSIKSIENEKSVNNSNRKHSGRTMRDSSQNSGLDDISHHSFKGSSEAPKIELKDSRHSKLCEVTHQKPHGIVAAPTFENRNPSPDKPSPQKKILLAKTVSIFQDNSGESSGDENGITHSNDSTLSPSDSSSMSGDSVGEAELSQSSTSKGSKDAKEKSTSKLEMHASSKDMTIEMILRSSKRFKKAKEVASQSESQPIDFDFVPDSQAPS